MLRYILKRILIFIPTLLLISLLTFVISVNTPGDPVEQMLTSRSGGEASLSARRASEVAYREKREELGHHLPVFYFGVNSAATPDTLYRIYKPQQREALKRHIHEYGNWDAISKYFRSLQQLESQIYAVEKNEENAEALIEAKQLSHRAYITTEGDEIRYIFEQFSALPGLENVLTAAGNARDNFKALQQEKEEYLNYIPSFQWYGINNQYHRWMFGSEDRGGFVHGNFGISYKSSRPVSDEIWEAVLITLQLSILAIIITFLIAIPLGVFSAARKGSLADQSITTFLFILYSLPAFWIGTLLIIFFGGGDFYAWFPPYGLGEIYPEMSFWEKLNIRAHHLVLPLICLVYPTFAYLSRQTRAGILQVLPQDYIKTAYAKGVPKGKVIWKHAFRNGLLPVITLFANIFPQVIVGAVVVEIVFSIPGMGKLTLEAFHARNYPIIYAIVMLSAILTMTGFLVADILYAIADPRISYGKNKRS